MGSRLIISLTLVLLFVQSCYVSDRPSATREPDLSVSEVSADCTAEALEWADSVMSCMTLEEMAGQLVMPASMTRADEYTLRRLKSYVADYKVGGIAFHKGDTLSMKSISSLLQTHSSVPLFIAIDAETGLGMRLKGASSYPANYKLSDVSEDWMYEYGNAVGQDCRRLGINMLFGPVLDVAYGPDSYVYYRSYGKDPSRVADLGIAYARGVSDAGIVPVGKHFPGHGHTSTDSHTSLPVIDLSVEEFRQMDLLPFVRYVGCGFPAVMTAHVAVPAFGGDTVPADLSAILITGLLRDELGFDGLVVSDALNMKAFNGSASDNVPASVRALQAGVDLLLAPADTRQCLDEIIEAVRTGELSVAVLREHCRRILFRKYITLNSA